MLLPNIHTVFEIEISIIANHTEIENLEKVSMLERKIEDNCKWQSFEKSLFLS